VVLLYLVERLTLPDIFTEKARFQGATVSLASFDSPACDAVPRDEPGQSFSTVSRPRRKATATAAARSFTPSFV
jgi:hypothetical protein